MSSWLPQPTQQLAPRSCTSLMLQSLRQAGGHLQQPKRQLARLPPTHMMTESSASGVT
jgi:hypothetical protein